MVRGRKVHRPVSRAGAKYCKAMVAVAQLVESRIVIPVVVGSNPISHPTPFHGARWREMRVAHNPHAAS